MASDENAEDPAGQMDRIFDLDFKIAIACRPATCPRRPFGSADGKNEATGNEHGGSHLRPIRRLNESTDFAFARHGVSLKASGAVEQRKGENDGNCLVIV
jgi:hypothetical protein